MDRPQQPPLLQLALLAAVITACSLAGWASAGRSLDHLQAPAGGAGLLAAVAIALLSLAWYRQNRQLRWRKAELRAQNLRLDAAVNNITQALLMFDAQARLILCNDRYREMYGLSEQDACAGTPLRTLLEHRARLGNFHGDPVQYCAEILADVTTGKTTGKTMELSDGRVIALINQPLAGGGWVCTHQDVTELKRREHELNVQNMRFVAALENMSHGLAMFDRERRLVICNERFVALYGLPPELSRPGTTLEQILQHRLASGSHVGEGQDFVQSRLAMVARGEPCDSVLRLRNDRFIIVGHRPMPDGGWVSTHEDVTDRRRSEERIAYLARHDTLTGLANRMLFRESMEGALARVMQGEMLALHCIDLDQFKGINDVLGHAVGDTLLKEVAGRIRSCVKDTDLVARFGGDEFAVVQVSLHSAKEAASLATRIVRELSRPYDCDGHRSPISASIGVAIAPSDGGDTDTLLRKADIAMYRAKADGRRTFCLFMPEMDAELQARRLLTLDLDQALKRHEFALFYQPMVDVQSGQVTGFEALLRWHHSERGLILPSDFIPLAEESGLIVELGEWILRRACSDAASWPEELSVAINLSPLQLRSRGLVRTVVHALAESGLPVGRLELEITESVLLQEEPESRANLAQLKNLGVAIAMDDFGTGYSSLSSLHRFSFDKIKIDRSFIADLSVGSGAIAIVRAVTSLANSLGIVVTAEGVETEEQLKRLRAEGCHEVQGYLFSPPRPASEILDVLARCRHLLVKAA